MMPDIAVTQYYVPVCQGVQCASSVRSVLHEVVTVIISMWIEHTLFSVLPHTAINDTVWYDTDIALHLLQL